MRLEMSARRNEASNERQETENWILETGEWRLEMIAGTIKLDMRDRRQETGYESFVTREDSQETRDERHAVALH